MVKIVPLEFVRLTSGGRFLLAGSIFNFPKGWMGLPSTGFLRKVTSSSSDESAGEMYLYRLRSRPEHIRIEVETA